MKTYHTFKDAQSFQKYLRTKHEHCNASGSQYGGCIDYVRVGGVLFTMHEFDSEGRYITWANKKKNQMLEITTANRYQDGGYDDAEVEVYPAFYLRNDIAYAE